jgi:hypothetical protein
MTHEAMDSLNANGVEKPGVSQSAAFEQSSLTGLKAESAPPAMTNNELEAHCVQEIDNFRRGDPSTGDCCLELLRRMTVEDNLEAREIVQKCLSETVRGWIEHHPGSTIAADLDNEESYMAQTFARFYQAIVSKRVDFGCLFDVLQCLQANLNSVILDTLRANTRPREILPSHTGDIEVAATIHSNSSEVWENLKKVLSDARERRMAFLLFNCGLSPNSIVQSFAEEFNDVQEINRLRHRIIKQLLCSEITLSTSE